MAALFELPETRERIDGERARIELALRLAAPLRSPAPQDDESSTPLFMACDEPGFGNRLEL